MDDIRYDPGVPHVGSDPWIPSNWDEIGAEIGEGISRERMKRKKAAEDLQKELEEGDSQSQYRGAAAEEYLEGG